MVHNDNEHRAMPAVQGVAWFQQAIRAFEHDARGLVQVASTYVLIQFLPQLLGFGKEATDPLLGLLFDHRPGLPLAGALVLLLFGPALTAGLLHSVGQSQSGRPVTVMDLFEGLRRPGVRTQLLVLGIFALVNAIILLMAMKRIIGPEHMKIVELATHKKLASSDPAVKAAAGPVLKALLAGFGVGVFIWSGLFFSVPRVMFEGRNALMSIYDSIAAVFANALALIGYLLLMAFAGIVLFVAVLVVGGILGGALLALLIVVAGMVCLVVGATGNYVAWRDVFAPSGGDHQPAQGGIIV